MHMTRDKRSVALSLSKKEMTFLARVSIEKILVYYFNKYNVYSPCTQFNVELTSVSFQIPSPQIKQDAVQLPIRWQIQATNQARSL